MKLKNLFLTAPLLFLSLSLNSVLADDTTKNKDTPLHSELVVVSANKGLEEKDQEFQRLFNHSNSPAIRLTFMVKTKNIIQVMKKSVTTNNSEGWKCGSFPRISEDSEAATFVIEKEGDFLGKANETKVEGTIEIQTGTKLIPKTFSLMSFDEPFRMDDFVFTLLQDKLKVEGNHKLIKELIVEQDDKILNTYGSGWSNDSRTYNYKGINKGAKITFSYWDGLVIKKVRFVKN